jgi:hypothetical protein
MPLAIYLEQQETSRRLTTALGGFRIETSRGSSSDARSRLNESVTGKVGNEKFARMLSAGELKSSLFARLFGESLRVVPKKEPIAFKNVQGCF